MELTNKPFEVFSDVVFSKEAGGCQLVSPDLDTRQIVLKKGDIYCEGSRPVASNLLFEKDTPFVLSDGVTLYADIFRPVNEGTSYPAILVWTPYGKTDPSHHYGLYYRNANLDPADSSGLATFEGPEPDFWTANDYAVVVVDSRGATHSGGDMLFFGNEEAIDICDVIDQVSKAEWCDGNIAMFGNSWLAISQFFAAARQPAALKAIAP